ncbi:hypothetical protein LO80_02410 [Candidatus Francisella endociliophora]|uniref:Chitin-binding type-3 domain-containing protein n=1 Tax=Candidatus Francisella endociliophora TaxID=653937 RepID=A0A097EN03_9GAMM|nr:lytic polysaccharide monooxygenase [Francisella sp. FSC1006]AIT08946.1 hypothetical protein LO80_02410 [Francisella sp. FSC1006]
MKINKITMLTTLAILASSEAYSHGYVESPAARGYMCKLGENLNCGSIVNEPQSIEAPDYLFNSYSQRNPLPSENGTPVQLLDKMMGSTGVSGFSQLDEQEQSRWAKTVVKPGQQLEFKWHFTANHSSNYFKYYITKKDWNPDQLLTRSSFEDKPLDCYFTNSNFDRFDRPPQGLSKTCNLPNREGYQVIMAVWDVADTTNSFYNLIDLEFSNDKTPGSIIDGKSTGSSSEPKEFNPESTYANSGTLVIYDGKVYKNKWYVNPNGSAPGTEQYGPWEYIRDYEETNPSNYKLMGTINASAADLLAGGKIYLYVFSNDPDSQINKEFEILDIKDGMSTADIYQNVAKNVNNISSEHLNNNIIAGVENASGVVSPSSDKVNIYQVKNGPYTQASLSFKPDATSVKNELHLMNFKDTYYQNSKGEIFINGQIMSHGSKTTNVSVVLQDSQGNQVDRKQDIMIAPMDTYDLSWKFGNLASGNYKLIISSEMSGAQAWQKAMDIKIAASGGGSDDVTKAKVSFEANTPFYYVKSQDEPVVAVAHYKDIGEVNFSDGQVIKINPWALTSVAIGNDNSTYVTCPRPTNNQSEVTYVVTGGLNDLSCKIK